MHQQIMLEMLQPEAHSFTYLKPEILPVLMIIGCRVLRGNLRDDMKYIEWLRADTELRGKDYLILKRKRKGILSTIRKADIEQLHSFHLRFFKTKTLLTLLGWEGKRRKKFEEELRTFLESERQHIKHNPDRSWYKNNIISLGTLSFTLCLGALILKKGIRQSIPTYSAAFQKEHTLLSTVCDPIRFMRYFSNGSSAIYWTAKNTLMKKRSSSCQRFLPTLTLSLKRAG